MSAPATSPPSTAEDPLSQKPAGETSFLDPVLDDLAAVEILLNEEIRSDVRAAYAISGHTLSAGGKRLRPALLVLSARAAQHSFPTRTITASASAAELIHMASLIHDDVVDNAVERRGRPTANAAYGNQISVLVGDYLLAKSIYLAAREGNIDVIRVFSNVTIGLSEGEVLQITAKGDVDTTEETYRKIIEKKTAGFIAGCCEIGGMLAEAPAASIAALASYGMNCGLAFQIADDLLDYTGDPKVTGKALDGDLREGKMTLPLILAVRDASDAERDQLMQTLQTPEDLTDVDIARVHRAIENCDGYRRTMEAAHAYAQSAKDALIALPPSIYRDSLAALADYAVTRQR
ncbi:MAG: polyprenyl synthetase family protein [Capsulimonas sp.]|uniref:polyprenyl synthetase family protein n=1 Tax=Capsulimonas sp. TaxID=2494211 RepID=UPI003263AE36